MNETLEIELDGAPLVLHQDRSAWCARSRTLFVADIHLGKSATFRAAGLPVPERTTGHDLSRLSAAVQRTAPETLVVLGDLLHAKSGRTEAVRDEFMAWRDEHAQLCITLVRGNHDRSSGDPPADWGIKVVDPGATTGAFTLMHEPPADAPYATLAGHIHPAVRLHDPAVRRSVRMPCFWQRSKLLVLPAFGSFTGTFAVQPGQADRVIGVTEEGLFDVTRLARSGR